MNRIEPLFALLLALFVLPLRADVLVLVHGYLGSADSWESSGVNRVLERNGWHGAGVVAPGPGEPRLRDAGAVAAGRRFYAVELPSIAPLMLQADHLDAMLELVGGLNPGEPVILVGHSAGGVVARIAAGHGLAPEDGREIVKIAAAISG